MKKYANAAQAKREIDSYEKHFNGSPLLIGIDGTNEYATLLSLLKDDYGKQIVHASDSCNVEFPPNPAFQISSVSEASKDKPVIWVGAVQSIMLYGQQDTEAFLINLLGSSFSGPVIVLCPFCSNMLEAIGRNYTKLGYNIAVINSEDRDIPSIHIIREDLGFADGQVIKSIKGLLLTLEEGKYNSDISVVTSCKFSYLEKSLFPVSEGISPYQLLCKIEPGIAANTIEQNGTLQQWQRLLQNLRSAKSLSSLCEQILCPVQRLPDDLGDYLALDADKRFLCFICLKVFFANGNDYLAFCLRKTDTVESFETRLYDSILAIDHFDTKFILWVHQRRRLLGTLDENNALMKDYCERATVKGKDILWYISDETEAERAALIHALCCYSYTEDELEKAFAFMSPQLRAYLQQFTFDEFNTRLMDSDSYVRSLLTDYFQRYKLQKISNRQDADFVELVEQEATARSFTKLQARSAIVKKLDKKDSQPYFFDALGVEYLSYIQTRAEEYGMQFECFIGHCNLPSITSKNKEFYSSFPDGLVLKEEGLDELKHHGKKFDYQFTPEPLHIFDELAILDRDLKKMSSALAMGKIQRVIILSDHGASRLAVTYQSENEKLELTEPGQHSGRCCPAAEDPQIPFATYEDGFAILANYERFKGSRKADIEAHGGASLEETVVPVIILTLKPKEQQLFFIETVISCSPKDGSSIRLFANPPLKSPRMVVDGHDYSGRFDGDKHNVIFEMPDIRRKGHHEADIYDGGVKVSVLPFETKRQTGTNQLI